MSTVIAATGHRPSPDRFPGDPITHNRLVNIAYSWLFDEQPDIVISGMALGWDQAVAKAAIILDIPVHAYIPFIGQADKWTKWQNEDYSNLLHQCAVTKIICRGGYSPEKFQRRNEAMVDDCDRVLALWDGSKGGTANCIDYAEMMERPIENLWSQFKP